MSHQHSWAEAFVSGLCRHGWKAEVSHKLMPSDLVAMWSTRRQDVIKQARSEGREMVIAERGYIGNRKHYCSVSFGGELNGRAEFRGPFGDAARFETLFAHLMHDWQPKPDGHALIMGQVDGDKSTRGVHLARWYCETREALEARGWKVKFRPHPLAAGGGAFAAYRQKQQADQLDLASDFEAAGVVVTYNSNSGVDAVLAGKPVVAMDEGAMCFPVAGHNADEIITPDRTAWAHALAWKQWTKDEMANGECIEAIGL